MMPAIKNQNWLPSLFNDFFGDEWLSLSQYKRMSTPAVNVIENEHDYTVEVAAPGMTKDDFHIDITADNELVINLEKRSETQQTEPAKTYGDKTAYDAGKVKAAGRDEQEKHGYDEREKYGHDEQKKYGYNNETAKTPESVKTAESARTTTPTSAATTPAAAASGKPAKKGHYLRREFSYSSFRQSFTLPESIERDKISAKMENGVLKIEIPKKTTAAATPATRCIEIK
ncbi:MAG: Hsp20/alpha crystallin family protein [Alistipes sp.]|nr:Hsp20/alpha crystallin family protein [Alistipes sp.]